MSTIPLTAEGSPTAPGAAAHSDELVAGLTGIVGAERVLTHVSRLLPYQSDGLPTYHQRPGLAVFPGSRDELVAVVRVLAEHRAAFVPRGAGTGLSGGALSDSTVLLGLNRLKRIISIDADAGVAVVEPGVVNASLTRATSSHGLHYAPDPSSQTACTIGGNLAENAGGPHCLKYGVTLNHVLAATVILPDGRIARLGSGEGERDGYDLLGAFVGSEGCFGVALDVTVRLTRDPQAVRTLLADFTSILDAARATSAIIAAGIVPAALEMMDAPTIRAVEASIYAAGYPADAAAVLLVELDGLEAGMDTDVAAVERICAASGARGVRVARNAAERALLWQGRKKAFGAMGRIAPQLVVQDAVVPRTKLPEILAEIHRISGRHHVIVCNVFHAGDGNLHPNIPYNAADADESARVHAAMGEIMQACIDAGGTVTGEHGIGLDKMGYMERIFSADTLDAMCRLRSVFDPERRSNPGKVVPVHSCREWHGTPAGRSAGTTHSRAPDGRDPGSVVPAARASTRNGEHLAGVVPAIPLRAPTGEHLAQGQTVSADVRMLAGRIREAGERGTVLRVVGGGSWLDAGRPVPGGERLEVAALRGIVEYNPGDLTITVRAGTRLSQLDATVRAEGQWLTLDPQGDPASTVGATFATASAGALAHAFGTPRDLVLGLEVVDGRGSVVRGGARVTKNVAGFDLVRLMTGAWGTLGVITELTLRLRALPTVDDSVAIALPREATQRTMLLRALRQAPLDAMAMEIVNAAVASALGIGADHGCVLVRLGGNDENVAAQRRTLRALGDTEGVRTDAWERLRRIEPAGAATWRRSASRSRIGALWEDAVRQAELCGSGTMLHATVNRGIVRCIVPVPDPDAIVASFSRYNAAVTSTIFERLPSTLWPLLAPVATDDFLSARMRVAFDPNQILNNGIMGGTSA